MARSNRSTRIPRALRRRVNVVSAIVLALAQLDFKPGEIAELLDDNPSDVLRYMRGERSPTMEKLREWLMCLERHGFEVMITLSADKSSFRVEVYVRDADGSRIVRTQVPLL